MKKIYLIMFTVFLNCVLFSCTPEEMETLQQPQACCDEGGEIPPPPPPPPPGDDG